MNILLMKNQILVKKKRKIALIDLLKLKKAQKKEMKLLKVGNQRLNLLNVIMLIKD